MRAREGRVWRPAVAGLLLLAACATSPAPPGFLPDAHDELEDAFGGWIELQLLSDRSKTRHRGELLAVHADSLFILEGSPGSSGGNFVGFPLTDIRRSRVRGYEGDEGAVVGWTIMGIVGTAAHGYYLVFTAPLWLISGITMANQTAKDPDLKTPEDSWPALRVYARFPIGLPPALDRRSLVPRPPVKRSFYDARSSSPTPPLFGDD